MTTIPHPAGGLRQQPNPDDYTVLSARFVNADGDTIEIMTKEAGAVHVTANAPAMWEVLMGRGDNGGTIAAYVPLDPAIPRDAEGNQVVSVKL